MERDVAIREWCLEKALQRAIDFASHGDEVPDAKEVIECAKKFEKFVVGNSRGRVPVS